jgi:hypothetical protein
MISFLLWLILLALCWPLALLLLLVTPLLLLLLLPLGLVGAIVGGFLMLVWGLITLPFRILFCGW